jgi:hypothetical protein
LPLPISRIRGSEVAGTFSNAQSTIFSTLSSPNLRFPAIEHSRDSLEKKGISSPDLALVSRFFEVDNLPFVDVIPAERY